MKKTLIRFVGVVLLFILASASSGNYYGVEVGEQAPNFEVNNETHSLQLQSLRGKYVVVTFWSSADADSRIANMMHDRAASSNENLEHVALNFDESQPLWNEICKLDGLNTNSQFYARNEAGAKLMKAWKQNEGFTSLLIDPYGVVVALNPSEKMLNQL